AEDTPDTTAAALDALRAAAPLAEDAPDTTTAALDALRAAAPLAEDAPDTTAAALDALRAAAPLAEDAPDTTAAALDAHRAATAVPDEAGETAGEDPLAALLADAASISDEDTDPGQVLASLLSDREGAPDPLADLLAVAAPMAGDTAEPLHWEDRGTGGTVSDASEMPMSIAGDIPNDDPLAGLDDLLAEPAPPAADDDPLAGLDDLLAEPSPPAADDDPLAGLDDLLAEPAPPAAADPLAGLDDLLAEPSPPAAADDPLAGLDDLLAEPAPPAADDDPLAGLDDLLAEPAPPAADDDPLAGLDDLLAEPAPPAADDDPLAGLDDLLGDSGAVPEPEPDALADLDDLLAALGPAPAEPTNPDPAEDDSMSLLDDLLTPPTGGPSATASPVPASPVPATPVPASPVTGAARITAPKPSAEALARPRFRMAIFGDFSGRAASGKMETGTSLAQRRAIELDVDTIEEVIEGFATRLVLPIGPEGRGIEVKLGGLDDLHPDEIVGNCEIFDALKGLRQRLSVPSMAARAVAEMHGWAGEFTTPVLPTHRQSAASSVPADRRLSDFQKLIGDTSGRLTQVSPVEDMIGQIIGPHVVPGPNPEAAALKASVDAAMGAAMKLILHHPEFQAIEAQWRGLDLLARRIETDVKLQIILFDVSAEEIAADLSTSDDLAQTGLFQLLNAPLQEEGGIGFSALFGLYSFEETPPHAELLTRIAQVAAHVEAPFFAAMTPAFLEVDLRDRHPLTARAWDDLRDHEAAGWLGLVTPRFLLRRPYGRKTDPIDAFDFEEFSEQEGLRGMLWANPVLLPAMLLAAEWKADGTKMTLGRQMSMGDMPYHFARDRHGDQVALPCTERNLTEAKTRHVMDRGFMPVVSVRGRDVVRLASFQSLAGSEIAGPWSGPPPARAPSPRASGLDLAMEIKRPPEAGTASAGTATAAVTATVAAADDDLDALLASFGDLDTPADPNEIDAELAALLEGL
ncbi:MAG: type VI secretion system contractile sheath domain-containing protein, partial [Pseudorhodobacter sp.]